MYLLLAGRKAYNWRGSPRGRRKEFGRESAREPAREGEAREEGTPARKPLFLPSRLLIMYAKITQNAKAMEIRRKYDSIPYWACAMLEVKDV